MTGKSGPNGPEEIRPGEEWGTPEPPYGPPLLDAVARGDLNEMKAVAEAARQSLYGVRFRRVSGPEEAREVREALATLEEAIHRLEQR
jgi:Domain of unknown function (DUF1843)